MTSLIHPTIQTSHSPWSWLIPYDRRTLVSPLPEATVHAQLAAEIERLNNAPKPGWLSSDARYEGTIDGDSFTFSGPLAQRRYSLETHGTIGLDPAGTRIDLALRLSNKHGLFALVQLAVLWAWALAIGFPVVLVLFLSGFLYVGTVLSAKYEASQIVRLVAQAAGPKPSPEATGAIVPDGVGWRCGACGGYVRRDARFCKHCKRPFES
jgi:hypothetical protein